MIICKRLADAALYITLNYIVANIPVWTIRKFLYMLSGMKIGGGSRIYMKCIIRSPWRIEIGKNTVINEGCILDGRGGLEIGDNTSISLFTTIITASHDSKSESFEYIKAPVKIKNNVWTGVQSVILQGSTIEDECILAAGSTLKGDTEKGYIYSGIPARRTKERGLRGNYTLSHYDFFR